MPPRPMDNKTVCYANHVEHLDLLIYTKENDYRDSIDSRKSLTIFDCIILSNVRIQTIYKVDEPIKITYSSRREIRVSALLLTGTLRQ